MYNLFSPTKILKEISPVPFITKGNTLKRRNDQTINLTSSENIKKMKLNNAPKKTIRETIRKSSKETQKELIHIKIFQATAVLNKK